MPISTKPIQPLHTTQPKERPQRPLTNKLMTRITQIIEESNGKLTRSQLAYELDKSYQEIIEWLGCRRSAPNSEMTLRLQEWADRHEKK